MNNTLFRFILPLIFLFLAFQFFGTIGGIIAIALYLALFSYLNRAVFLQSRAGKKYQKGDYDGALQDLDKAVALSPNQYKIRGTYAYLLVKLGHTEKAAEHIAKTMEMCRLEADRNTMKVTEALVLWKQNRLDEAIAVLVELMKTYQNSNVYGALGFLYIESGDYEKALSFNLEAFDYNSSNTIILDNLGLSYFLNKDYDKALETYKTLMGLKPNFPEAFYNYGLVLEHFGDEEEALYMYRTAQSQKFWNISTIAREQVDEAVNRLDEKVYEKARIEKEKRMAALEAEDTASVAEEDTPDQA